MNLKKLKHLSPFRLKPKVKVGLKTFVRKIASGYFA